MNDGRSEWDDEIYDDYIALDRPRQKENVLLCQKRGYPATLILTETRNDAKESSQT